MKRKAKLLRPSGTLTTLTPVFGTSAPPSHSPSASRNVGTPLASLVGEAQQDQQLPRLALDADPGRMLGLLLEDPRQRGRDDRRAGDHENHAGLTPPMAEREGEGGAVAAAPLEGRLVVVLLGGAACALGTALQLGVSPFALAQSYPSRPINVIVAFPPGGNTDIMARALQNEMSKAIGQTIVIINKPGAAGTLGLAEVSRAAPDGYTIAVTPNNPLTAQPHVQKLPYAMDSFRYVCLTYFAPYVLIAGPQAPFKTFDEFVGFAVDALRRKDSPYRAFSVPGAVYEPGELTNAEAEIDGGWKPAARMTARDAVTATLQPSYGLSGDVLVTRAAVPLLKKSPNGCIVNTCSIAGLRPSAQPLPYAASKASSRLPVVRSIPAAAGSRAWVVHLTG